MGKQLLSVGLDVGTTTTQLIVSRLLVENRESAFAVPEMQITERQILYKGPVHFTPLLDRDHVDGKAIGALVAAEYENAGIAPEQVDTGAVIITGETSRKENARAVLDALAALAGDFVVATAGPHLESVLAAKGAGATDYSEKTGKTVLHMDIGGGTANLAWIENGNIIKTGCLNVGGRLVKLDEAGKITYVSPVLAGLVDPYGGLVPVAELLTQALEMAAGLRPRTELLDKLWTAECGEPWELFEKPQVLSFSGGVADCMEKQLPDLAFGDIGPLLGQQIRQSLLCRGEYRLGSETIRATVIGAGCHSAQLSGSTVFYQNITFPLKNLPVIRQPGKQEETAVLALKGMESPGYQEVGALADKLASSGFSPMLLALEADMAKALGHALSLRLPNDAPLLCIDRVRLKENSYLDIGAPVGPCLPLVVKTLVLSKENEIPVYRSNERVDS